MRWRAGLQDEQLVFVWENRTQQPSPAGETARLPLLESPVEPVRKRRRSLTPRPVTQLPVPKPLPEAVAAGRFGVDDDGKSIRPRSDEVRAITEQHADKLVELFSLLGERTQRDRDALQVAFDQAVCDYAEDFGREPADRLAAYARWLSTRPEVHFTR